MLRETFICVLEKEKRKSEDIIPGTMKAKKKKRKRK